MLGINPNYRVRFKEVSDGVQAEWTISVPEGTPMVNQIEVLHNENVITVSTAEIARYGVFTYGSLLTQGSLMMEGSFILEDAVLSDLLGVRASTIDGNLRWSTNNHKPPFLSASAKKIVSRFEEEVEYTTVSLQPSVRPNGMLVWRVINE